MTRRTTVIRYSANDHQQFIKTINETPHDTTSRGVYADYLDENGGHVDPNLPELLRQGNGPMRLYQSKNGVVGGPHITWDEIRERNNPGLHSPEEGIYGFFEQRGSHPPLTEEDEPINNPISGPGGHFFVTHSRYSDPEHGGLDYSVHQFHDTDGGIELGIDHDDSEQGAMDSARELASTPPPARPAVTPPSPPVSPPPPPPPAAPKGPPKPVSLADLMRPRPTKKSRRDVIRYVSSPFTVSAPTLVNKAPALPESLVGSKIALVLHELLQSSFTRDDPKLRQLANHALSGYTTLNGEDVYSAIGTHLKRRAGIPVGGYDRAAKLATAFNWHKVSGALDVDRVLSKFIRSKGRKDVVDAGWAHRTAHDAYGNGWDTTNSQTGIDSNRREQVLEAMRSHITRELKGYVPAGEITRDAVLRSLHRLAHGEHAREVLSAKPKKTQVRIPDHPVQAHTETVKGPRVNPRRGPDQFTRRKYSKRDIRKHVRYTYTPTSQWGGVTVTAWTPKFHKKSERWKWTRMQWASYADVEEATDKHRGLEPEEHSDLKGPATDNENGHWWGRDLTEPEMDKILSHEIGGEVEERPNETIPEDFYSMSRRNLTYRYSLFSQEPVVDTGVLHTSHPEGRFSGEATAAVLAERSAVLHSLNVLGLVPPRNHGESPEQYAARISQAVEGMTQELNDHVANNPTDPVVQRYKNLANWIEAPDDAGRDEAGRIVLPHPTVSTMGLSAALAPLVARLAEEAGLRVGKHRVPGQTTTWAPPTRRVIGEAIPDQPLPPEPGSENSGDLLDLATIDDYAAAALHGLDRSEANRAAWGSARGSTEPLHEPTGTTDFPGEFDLWANNLPGADDLPPSDTIESVQKASVQPRAARMPTDLKRAIHATIKDHLENTMGHIDPQTGEHVPPEASVLDAIVQAHGISKRSASAVYGGYKRNADAASKRAPDPAPTKRVWPPTPRTERLTRRSSVKRYSATEGDTKNLLRQLAQPEHYDHRRGLDDPLMGLRGVAADALDEQGRTVEARILRTPKQRIQVHEGVVRREYGLPEHHREVAHGWHSGGGSGLYQIASTGVVNGKSARRALSEIDDIYGSPTNLTGLDNPNERADLDRLYNHLSRIERETADEEEPDETPQQDNTVTPPTTGGVNLNEDPDSYPGESPVPMSRRRINVVKGGVGDKTKVTDVDATQLKEGEAVEREHTQDPKVARDIAIDHLTEDSNYYKKLKAAKLSRRSLIARYAEGYGGDEAPSKDPPQIPQGWDFAGEWHNPNGTVAHEEWYHATCPNCMRTGYHTIYPPESDGTRMVECPECGHLDEEQEWLQDQPEQYAKKGGQFRAPKGGMVARGTFYKGGQRIPSVGGDFMTSGRRRPKRKPRRPKAQVDTSDHLPIDTGNVGNPVLTVGYKKSRRQYGRHLDFHNVAEAEPKELTHSRMYADALREEGRERHAQIVEQSAQTYEDNGSFGMYGGGPAQTEGQSWIRVNPHGDTWGGRMPTSYTVQLHINTGMGPHAARSFAVNYTHPDEAYDTVRQLVEEGAFHREKDEWGWRQLQRHVGLE